MSPSRADLLIRDWHARFRKNPLASSIVSGLHGRSDEIWRGTFELLQRESPEYRNSVDDEFTKESKSHCNELLKMIVAIAAGPADKSGADPFDFVRTHAEWRARRRVPLTASLHAYRLAHRTYWGVTREALLRHTKQDEVIPSLTMLSDFWIEFFDHVGAVLAEAHAVEEGLIVAQSTRSYVRLIDELLDGLEPQDAEAVRLCTLCGIRPGAAMTVAVARPLQSGNGKQIDLEVTLRSFVHLIDQVLPSAIFGKLVDIRNGEVTAIACSDTDTARGLVAALRRNGFARRAANGVAAGVGIGLDTNEIARLPRALEEARLALDFASATRPLVHFPDIDLPEFLIRRADSAAVRLVPEWARHFSPADDEQARELSRTIRAFADSNFNVKQTARRLGVHANTVYFRLNRINKLTGIDPRTYSGTSFLLTALRLVELHRDGAHIARQDFAS
jgi:transposase-like protein